MTGLEMTGAIKTSFNREENNSKTDMGKWWDFFSFFPRFPMRCEFPLAFQTSNDLANCIPPILNHHMDISFFNLGVTFLELLFHQGIKDSRVNDLLGLNTLINMLPNRNQASKISDLGTNHLLIVRRLKVINEPLNHLIFHHRGLQLCG